MECVFGKRTMTHNEAPRGCAGGVGVRAGPGDGRIVPGRGRGGETGSCSDSKVVLLAAPARRDSAACRLAAGVTGVVAAVGRTNRRSRLEYAATHSCTRGSWRTGSSGTTRKSGRTLACIRRWIKSERASAAACPLAIMKRIWPLGLTAEMRLPPRAASAGVGSLLEPDCLLEVLRPAAATSRKAISALECLARSRIWT